MQYIFALYSSLPKNGNISEYSCVASQPSGSFSDIMRSTKCCHSGGITSQTTGFSVSKTFLTVFFNIFCVKSSMLFLVPIPANFEAIVDTTSRCFTSATGFKAHAIGIVDCPSHVIRSHYQAREHLFDSVQEHRISIHGQG